MKKNKICVYAIAKNEEKFVDRWYNSMKEADKIIVLDTGSNDNTVKLLKERGVEVYEKIFNPFRFDVARNDVLNLIPKEYSICVCTDLDEVFVKGWKEKLLNIWNDDITAVKTPINWSFDEYGKPGTTYLTVRIHKRDGYIWTHPVHEILTPIKEEKVVICEDIILNHYQDKTKPRTSYLSLLELSVEEDPNDARNMHYLGREYMYNSKWNDCITTLKKHIKLKSATWDDENAASMRFIARSYNALGNIKEAKKWYKKAIKKVPNVREGYIELAYLYYMDKDYKSAYINLKKALEINIKSKTYINEDFAWNSFVYDLLSLVAFNLELYKEAFDNIRIAYELDKNNLRLQINLEEMEKYVNT